MNPQSAKANEGMGLLSLRQQKFSEAKKFFSAAAELDPNSFISQFYAAQAAYEENADYDIAMNRLRKALQINPKFVPAYQLLSQLLMRQEATLPEALAAARKAAELEPAERIHHLLFGQILINMGKFEEAKQVSERLMAEARDEEERRQAESLLFLIKDRQDRQLEAKHRAEFVRQQAEESKARLKELKEVENRNRAADSPAVERSSEAKPVTVPVKTGPAAKLGGMVQSVMCTDPAVMDVVLNSNGKQLILRADNYFTVKYWAVGSKGKTGFQPCEELKGKKVGIEYLSVTGQDYSGLIQTVEISGD
jgi:tetratricopeptide (TPR) repeat protein